MGSLLFRPEIGGHFSLAVHHLRDGKRQADGPDLCAQHDLDPVRQLAFGHRAADQNQPDQHEHHELHWRSSGLDWRGLRRVHRMGFFEDDQRRQVEIEEQPIDVPDMHVIRRDVAAGR